MMHSVTNETYKIPGLREKIVQAIYKTITHIITGIRDMVHKLYE